MYKYMGKNRKLPQGLDLVNERLQYGLTYPLPSDLSEAQLAKLVPHLRAKGYRLDQPVFYGLAKKYPKLVAEIFNPQIYSPRPIMVKGIYTASVHRSDLYRKNIIILGDMHTPQSKCPRSSVISEYIAKILRDNKQTVFDIFVETIYHKDDEDERAKRFLEPKMHQGFLFGHTRKKFADCLRVDKTACNYKNLRMHYADMRLVYAYIYVLMPYVTGVLYNLSQPGDVIGIIENAKLGAEVLIKEIRPARAKPGYVSKKTDVVSWTLKKFKISRQLGKCPYPKVKEYLSSYLERRTPQDGELEIFLKSVTERWQQLKPKMSKQELTDLINKHWVKYPKIHEVIDGYLLAIMDVYLVARAFSKFNNTAEDIAEPHNVIIMAGNAHCDNFREMLSNLHFVNIGKTQLATTTGEEKCIDMSQFPLSNAF